MYENTYPNKRFGYTLEFLKKHISTDEPVLDLGVENPFSKVMKAEGYQVENTSGEDLDVVYTLQGQAEDMTYKLTWEHYERRRIWWQNLNELKSLS